MDRILDATGLKCPKPLFEVSRALKELEPGAVLQVTADDPAFKLDIEAWCRRTGNDLLDLQRDQSTFTALRAARRLTKGGTVPDNKLMIILTTGPEDRGNRATLAFAMGVSSLDLRCRHYRLHDDGRHFLVATDRLQQGAHRRLRPAVDHIEQFAELGGKVLVCSPCHEFYCSVAKDAQLLPGAELAGLTHVVDQVLSASVVTL